MFVSLLVVLTRFREFAGLELCGGLTSIKSSVLRYPLVLVSSVYHVSPKRKECISPRNCFVALPPRQVSCIQEMDKACENGIACGLTDLPVLRCVATCASGQLPHR